jgi:hypothetical protein
VDQVIAADRGEIAVAGVDHNIQFRICQLQASRKRDRAMRGVLSKLKRPVFLAHDMSGFIVNQQQSGLWESGNPAHFAGFPSGVGKSGL